MALKEEFYYRSPIFIQNWLTSLYGRKLMQERYGPFYEQKMKELRMKDRTQDYKAEQLDRLNAFLAFVVTHTPYYTRLFHEHEIQLPLTSLEQLKTIPILEKETLRQNNDAFMSRVDAPSWDEQEERAGSHSKLHSCARMFKNGWHTSTTSRNAMVFTLGCVGRVSPVGR
ncbi:hypothetical protein OVA29_03420 [Exiguobacterium sp. SL14]|nr:hypothetical protein [Exiguobacterium sp. SL14]MCY1689981.1 hypothetical protein [Exiguobacterium sp. SL14]